MDCLRMFSCALQLPTLLILTVCLVSEFVDATLTTKPNNTVVILGSSSTVLQCRTSGSTVTWQFTDIDDLLQPAIYINNALNPAYKGVNISNYDLRFTSVNWTNVGTYTCQDTDGSSGSAWLSILDSAPNCSTNSTTNSTILTCTATIYGRIAQSQPNRLEPILEWINCTSLLNNETLFSGSNHVQYTARAELGNIPTATCTFRLRFRTIATSDTVVNNGDPAYNYVWRYPASSTTTITPRPSSSATRHDPGITLVKTTINRPSATTETVIATTHDPAGVTVIAKTTNSATTEFATRQMSTRTLSQRTVTTTRTPTRLTTLSLKPTLPTMQPRPATTPAIAVNFVYSATTEFANDTMNNNTNNSQSMNQGAPAVDGWKRYLILTLGVCLVVFIL